MLCVSIVPLAHLEREPVVPFAHLQGEQVVPFAPAPSGPLQAAMYESVVYSYHWQAPPVPQSLSSEHSAVQVLFGQ